MVKPRSTTPDMCTGKSYEIRQDNQRYLKMKGVIRTGSCLVLAVLLAGIGISASAQEAVGVSVGYEYIPHVNFEDPDPGMEDVEI